ncbi:zinc-binding dehydrogenase [Arthrobacter sp. Cr_A7]|uniref:zinc-binding dehydrogenase n=1 Tax=Arthrobacter sp. Cr_A7 TaxID=3031017 RepID=UPI0023DA6166|nr:zinc-binding dehydrogenase [Arthrobacter sp. Cr_A7]MDF2050481.1 zinc-binding dehydrogenase [Arthrobacter sp. Cr_A7]
MSLPRESTAAVLVAYNKPLEMQSLPVPELEPRGILVKVEASTMCGTDVHIWRGSYADTGMSKLPLVLGHEIVGRVVALGRDRKVDALNRPLAEGDRVAWSYAWCGQCYWCTTAKQPTQCENARMYGWGPADKSPYLTGGYSEYAYIMPECSVVKAPAHVDAAVLASATCAFRTVFHGYEKIGKIETTDTVVIQGSGPVGLYALAYAIKSGACRTIMIGAPAARLDIAKRWGAEIVLDVLNTDPSERKQQILDATDGRGADLVVECSGVNPAFVEGMNLIRRGGRYLVLGASDPRPAEIHPTYFNLRQLTVAGTMSGDISHYYRALSFLEAHENEFSFGDLLSSRYRLDEVDAALAGMEGMTEIKPVILPSLPTS